MESKVLAQLNSQLEDLQDMLSGESPELRQLEQNLEASGENLLLQLNQAAQGLDNLNDQLDENLHPPIE